MPELNKNLLLVVAPERIANAAWLAINHPSLAIRAAHRAMIDNWRAAPEYAEQKRNDARRDRVVGILVPIAVASAFLYLGYSLLTWQNPFPDFAGGSDTGGHSLFVVVVQEKLADTTSRPHRRRPKVLFADNGQHRSFRILKRPIAACV
jgi:hypothetical protein